MEGVLEELHHHHLRKRNEVFESQFPQGGCLRQPTQQPDSISAQETRAADTCELREATALTSMPW